MNYFSTRDKSLKFSFKDIFLRGLAPGGGLFLPAEIKKYNQEELNNLNEQPDLDANQKDEMVSDLQEALNEKQEELQNLQASIQKFQNDEFKKSFIEKIPAELNNYLSYQNSSSARILELIDNDT